MKESLISEVMREMAKRRWAKPGASGSGRPRKPDRCKCGKYTKHTAKLRNHVCQVTGI
jgi:hypothetical protein